MKVDHGAQVAALHGLTRSPHWGKVEKEVVEQNPYCLACGPDVKYERGLQVHHARIPFHFAILLGRPDLELDPRNLVVLCEDEHDVDTEDHHLLLGHGRNFQRYIPDVAALATGKYHGMGRAEILADPDYAKIVEGMPPVWKDWTDEMKTSARKDLDDRFPLTP